jgi:hypothetical protein
MDKDIAIDVEGAFTQVFKGKTTYEEFKALDDVSFEACPNRSVSFVSRCGRVKKAISSAMSRPSSSFAYDRAFNWKEKILSLCG